MLDLARAHGLKVIISLLDNWKYNGAPPGAWGLEVNVVGPGLDHCAAGQLKVARCAAWRRGLQTPDCRSLGMMRRGLVMRRALQSDSAKSLRDPDVCVLLW